MPALLRFSTQITLPASARRAFDGFVDPAALRQWYSPAALADAQIGGRCQFEFSERRQAYDEFWTIAEIKIGRELRFGWENFGRMGGLHARVIARFDPLERNLSRLTLTHTLVRDPADCAELYKSRWRERLAALKDYLAQER